MNLFSSDVRRHKRRGLVGDSSRRRNLEIVAQQKAVSRAMTA